MAAAISYDIQSAIEDQLAEVESENDISVFDLTQAVFYSYDDDRELTSNDFYEV